MQIVIRRNVVRSNVLQRFRILGKIVSAIASEISLAIDLFNKVGTVPARFRSLVNRTVSGLRESRLSKRNIQ